MRPARTERDVTVALAVSPFNSLVFHSAYIGGMNAPRCYDFLAQTRQNLDPDEEIILFYDGTSKSRHSRGQYQAGDAPGLQPIPEQSGAGNRLTEGSDKKIRIEGAFRAIECRLVQMNVFSHYCLTLSGNDCVFSLNEQQKV